MARADKTSIRHAAAQATLALPFRISPQEWFTLRQSAAALGLTESTIERLYDRGDLTGHSHNAGNGEREHKRVLRASLIAYAIRTADYTDESLGDALLTCLPHLPATTLLRISAACNRIAADRPIRSA